MTTYRPPVSRAYRRAMGDLPPAQDSTVRNESALPDIYTLERLGIRSDTEFIPIDRGEIVPSSSGDYLYREVVVPTAAGIVTRTVLSYDFGYGQVAIDEDEDDPTRRVIDQVANVVVNDDDDNEDRAYTEFTQEPETRVETDEVVSYNPPPEEAIDYAEPEVTYNPEPIYNAQGQELFGPPSPGGGSYETGEPVNPYEGGYDPYDPAYAGEEYDHLFL